MRSAARVDTAHPSVVRTFTRLGWQVLSLAALGKGAPDLLCCSPQATLHLVEVKSPSARTKPETKARQAAFASRWPVIEIRTEADVLALHGKVAA